MVFFVCGGGGYVRRSSFISGILCKRQCDERVAGRVYAEMGGGVTHISREYLGRQSNYDYITIAIEMVIEIIYCFIFPPDTIGVIFTFSSELTLYKYIYIVYTVKPL